MAFKMKGITPFKSKDIKKHLSVKGGFFGLKNINLGKGLKGNFSGKPGGLKGNVTKNFNKRNVKLNLTGSWNKNKGGSVGLGIVKRF